MTSSSLGTGRWTSSSRRTSGGPYRSWTTALMRSPPPSVRWVRCRGPPWLQRNCFSTHPVRRSSHMLNRRQEPPTCSSTAWRATRCSPRTPWSTSIRGWRRLVTELGIEFLHPEARPASAGGRRAGGGRPPSCGSIRTSCWSRPRSRRRASTLYGPQPGAPDFVVGGEHMAFCPVQGPPFVRRGSEAARGDPRGLRRLLPHPSRARLRRRHAAEPTTRRSTPAIWTWLALQTLTDKPYMGSVHPAKRGRHDRDGRDPVREPRNDRGDAGLDLADQRQLATALRRPHARCDAPVRTAGSRS